MLVTAKEPDINYVRIERAIQYLEEHFRRQPSLDEVAEHVHLSPFHFQRMFSSWAGVTPKRFLQFLTIDFLKDKLASSKSILEATELAGLSSQSRVYDLFTTLEGVTPQEYRMRGQGIQVSYGIHATPFGMALLGTTERGICWISFITSDEDPKHSIEQMKGHWHNALFREDTFITASLIDRIFYGSQKEAGPLHLFVKGTTFQLKVWEALLRIPMGSVTTYQGVAEAIGQPRAVQAVGSAVGANQLAYLIPCHRVIRKDGVLAEYRWSPARKKGILGWEFGKIEGEN
ncbi:methylated-DNA--[protein]-cysteine S-methyltransferase [Chryseolinea sp. T2]|uniref:bifunctional transcriptional activator/DNA repair enzyme AdaA n=1 Tax=Chryseolinea sp. T2 TaxID=3129255 RepID=UPI0030772A27